MVIFQIPKKDSAELDVNEVGGMFVILILGCMLGFLFSLLEFLWNIRKVAVAEKVISITLFFIIVKRVHFFYLSFKIKIVYILFFIS